MNQVRGNRNPRHPEIRWSLGTAIKSRQRAAPYPDTRKQKDAAPKLKEGSHEKKEENAAFATWPSECHVKEQDSYLLLF